MSPISIDSGAPFFIVFNVASGQRDPVQVRASIEQILTAEKREFEIFSVEEPNQLESTARHAVERARGRGGVVVAAGGDGTLKTVAQATLGSGCAFGVLPQGTFNYFSRTHGIPSDTQAALATLMSARAHPVQVGLVNDRVFLVNASLGLYPQLLEDREAYKQQYGRTRGVALLSGLVTLVRDHQQLQLRIEDHVGRVQELLTPTLFVGNNALQLEQIGMAEASAVADGRLAAIAVRPVGALGLLWLLLRGALGRLGEADQIQSFTFQRITVKPRLTFRKRWVKVAADGEIAWLKAPLEFRVSPVPLMLLRPEVEAMVRA